MSSPNEYVHLIFLKRGVKLSIKHPLIIFGDGRIAIRRGCSVTIVEGGISLDEEAKRGVTTGYKTVFKIPFSDVENVLDASGQQWWPEKERISS